MQQSQPQRGRIVSAFQTDGTTNQKRTGNGPTTYSRGGPKKRTFRKKPHFNQTEKTTENTFPTKGKGQRPKFFSNKTLILNKKKNNEFPINGKNSIEEINFSFKNAQQPNDNAMDELEDNENSNIVDLTQNNIVDKETREQRFNANPFGNNYQKMKKDREHLRKMYIKKGLIDDPDKPRRLEDAIPFVGECQDMCPEFERYEREYQKNLDKFEIDQELSTDEISYVDHLRAVKRYQRSDAGKEQPLPCDVRPPPILKKTLNYLIDEIIMKHGIESSHGFVRDRTRSIRQDFSLQNIRDKSAVDAHERIARYHILCLHQLCEKEGFSIQQEKEQLFKVLQSLQEFYDEGKEKNIKYPNEAEFRAYYIISHLFDSDIVRKAELYSKDIFFNPMVQLALDFQSLAESGRKREAGSLNLYSRIFKRIFSSETPYLMACLMEIHFISIRKYALIAMNHAVKFRGNVLPPYPAEKLKDILGFDTIDDLLDILTYYSIEIEDLNGNYGIIFNKSKSLTEPEVSLNQKRTERLERKRENISDREIINGGSSPDDTYSSNSMFSFSQPNVINNGNLNNNAFNNSLSSSNSNMNSNQSFVGFSFNNPNVFNKSNDNMTDINMDSNDSGQQNNSMSNSISLSMKSNISNKPQSTNIPFSFNQPQTTNTVNPLKTSTTPSFSFASTVNKNNTSTNEKPADKPSELKSTIPSTLNQKPTFSFNLNNTVDKNKPESNKPSLFNTTNADKTEAKPVPTFNFGNTLNKTSTVDFNKQNQTDDNNKKPSVPSKSTFSFGNTIKPATTSKPEIIGNKSNNNNTNIISNTTVNTTFNNIPQEITNINTIIANEKIRKENQQKFMENDLKRKSLMQNLSLRNHNIGVRPKPPLDEAIMKSMEKKKELENESKSSMQSNAKNIFNSLLKEGTLKNNIYNDIISTITKEIIKEELINCKKEEKLLNNYYDALDLCTNDILNEVVSNYVKSSLKNVYDVLLKEEKARKLKLKKEHLKRKMKYFNEKMKLEKMKYAFSKWNHIVKLRENERRINEEKIKMKKLEFDKTIRLMEVGPGFNNKAKKNNEFIFKHSKNNIIKTHNNKIDDEYFTLDYDYEEDNVVKFNDKSHVNIKDIAVSLIKKRSFKNVDDSVIYLKIMTSFPNDSKKTTNWISSQFNIGRLNNNIINLSQENESYYYNIEDYIHFSQGKLKDQKMLSIVIQNIPYTENNEMDWEEKSNDDNDNDNENENKDVEEAEYYSSAGIFQLSVYYFQQDSDPEEIAYYWSNERKRLELFLHKIRNHSSIPIILLYWKSMNLNNRQYIEDAKYYLRLDQFFNDQQIHNYQFLSIPYSKDIISMPISPDKDLNLSNESTSNKVEKLNLGMTWLIEKCHLYSLSSNVVKEIIYNNFYTVFLMTILKHIENEIPFGTYPIENATWLKATSNVIIESFNNIIDAIIEFLYSSQVQYITIRRKDEKSVNINGNGNVEYEDSEGYNSTTASSCSFEPHRWITIYDTIQERINKIKLPEFNLDHPLAQNKIQSDENLLGIFEYYVQSVGSFKSRQKLMVAKEIKKLIRNYLSDSNLRKFPYHKIFDLIIQHTFNNLQEILSDYEIYFIKLNLTKNTEEIGFFEDLLEDYKNTLYELLSQWSNTTLSEIEKSYFNEQNKRKRDSIEDSWIEISKKYQRTESSKIKRKSLKQNHIKKTLPTTSDIKIEQKLLKDLINSVRKEFPYLKNKKTNTI